MATYEYDCINCDKRYDKQRSIHEEEPPYICDVCGYALTRVYSTFGIDLKGNGWASRG